MVMLVINRRFIKLMMNDYTTLLQITDCHLQEHADIPFKGFYPDARLDQVIAGIKNTRSKLEQPLYDHLLLTGDLAHDTALSVYARILEKTKDLAQQRHWIPGNHDDLDLMTQFSEVQSNIIVANNWGVVLLNSTSNPNGIGSGSLSITELDLLASSAHLEVEHLLVVLHHPPIDLGSRWQDEIKLANADEFWRVLKTIKKVRAIVFGHVHQEHHVKINGIELFATPATAPQFKKGQVTPVLEDNPEFALPAYREFKLFSDGCIETQVYRANR